MMSHLDRETCQALAKAGFEQTIEKGDWYYNFIDPPEWGPHLSIEDLPDTGLQVKCPSTGELIGAVVRILWANDLTANRELQMYVRPYGIHVGPVIAAAINEGICTHRADSTSLDAALAVLYLKLKGAEK
jgi:hypothetical protein